VPPAAFERTVSQQAIMKRCAQPAQALRRRECRATIARAIRPSQRTPPETDRAEYGTQFARVAHFAAFLSIFARAA